MLFRSSGELPSDDVTLKIPPGDSYQYESFFPANHAPGTHWIHPHVHGSSLLQVGGGAAMALIVEDEPGAVPPEVEEAEDVLLVVQNVDVNLVQGAATESRDGLFNIDSNVGNSFRLVNGQYRPSHSIVAGEFQRWRVIFANYNQNWLDLEIEAANGNNGECEMFLLALQHHRQTRYSKNFTIFPTIQEGIQRT